ncbi:MAG: hypothetical protein ABS81_28370 [Pseudonocardia sp. SCN 72-86]|nr:MAG: hypothetical protein ABS81_28370 [Pseudonocardia sp. SCN 72-86]
MGDGADAHVPQMATATEVHPGPAAPLHPGSGADRKFGGTTPSRRQANSHAAQPGPTMITVPGA